MPESIALNCDCMEYMRSLPDKALTLPWLTRRMVADVHSLLKQRESRAPRRSC
mgnify:CR=1 FL=1